MAEKRPLKLAKRFVRFWLLHGLLALVSLLPLEAAKRLGARLGALGYALAGKERRKALTSLAVAFPEKTEAEREALARDCFRHLGVLGAEVCQHRRIDPVVERYVELPEASARLLAEVHAARKGCVFITGHVGNFELLARRFGKLGYPCQTVAKESSDPRMTALIRRIRESGGYKILFRGEDGLYDRMVGLLEAGEYVGFLVDQDIKTRGVFVDFFGRPAFTARAAADLALQTGAAVVTGFVFRREDGGHRFEVGRLEVPCSGDREADAVALTAAMSKAIESAIRRAPHAWVWMHQRWKTQP
ncbi:MAG TPA: lipid A biosynthesis acyltransferase [Myxococcales bacterium]|jgi:KDO2-lipid IV(A) lauroyltransferase